MKTRLQVLGLLKCSCSLQGVSFGVFGLGNRQYEHFCAVGKVIHKCLGELGAAPIVRRGDGDDDGDIDADFDSWKADLFTALDSSEIVAKSEVFQLVTQLGCARFSSNLM